MTTSGESSAPGSTPGDHLPFDPPMEDTQWTAWKPVWPTESLPPGMLDDRDKRADVLLGHTLQAALVPGGAFSYRYPGGTDGAWITRHVAPLGPGGITNLTHLLCIVFLVSAHLLAERECDKVDNRTVHDIFEEFMKQTQRALEHALGGADPQGSQIDIVYLSTGQAIIEACATLGVPRSFLRVCPTPTGNERIFGDYRFIDRSRGVYMTTSHEHSIEVPISSENQNLQMRMRTNPALFVTLESLCGAGSLNRHGLIEYLEKELDGAIYETTLEGMPSDNVARFQANRSREYPDVPNMIITDGDVRGLEIVAGLRVGYKSSTFQATTYAQPRLQAVFIPIHIASQFGFQLKHIEPNQMKRLTTLIPKLPLDLQPFAEELRKTGLGYSLSAFFANPKAVKLTAAYICHLAKAARSAEISVTDDLVDLLDKPVVPTNWFQQAPGLPRIEGDVESLDSDVTITIPPQQPDGEEVKLLCSRSRQTVEVYNRFGVVALSFGELGTWAQRVFSSSLKELALLHHTLSVALFSNGQSKNSHVFTHARKVFTTITDLNALLGPCYADNNMPECDDARAVILLHHIANQAATKYLVMVSPRIICFQALMVLQVATASDIHVWIKEQGKYEWFILEQGHNVWKGSISKTLSLEAAFSHDENEVNYHWSFDPDHTEEYEAELRQCEENSQKAGIPPRASDIARSPSEISDTASTSDVSTSVENEEPTVATVSASAICTEAINTLGQATARDITDWVNTQPKYDQFKRAPKWRANIRHELAVEAAKGAAPTEP